MLKRGKHKLALDQGDEQQEKKWCIIISGGFHKKRKMGGGGVEIKRGQGSHNLHCSGIRYLIHANKACTLMNGKMLGRGELDILGYPNINDNNVCVMRTPRLHLKGGRAHPRV